MITYIVRATLICFLVLLNACGGTSAPGSAPANFRVVPGDGSVTVTWDQQPNMKYYLFLAQSSSATRDTITTQPSSDIKVGVTSPFVLTGLTNGQIYAFLMNAGNGNSAGGPSTATITATPAQAGITWTTAKQQPSAGQNESTTVSTIGTPASTVLLNTFGIDFLNNVYVAVGCTDSNCATTTNTNINNTNKSSNNAGAIYSSQGAIGFNWQPTYTGTNKLNATLATLAPVVGYVTVGANGTILVSADALTWTAKVATPTITANLNALSTSGGYFIAVGDGGTVVTSPDGLTWTTQTTNGFIASTPKQVSALGTTELNGVAYSNGLYVAVGSTGTIFTSSDTVNWTQVPATKILASGVASPPPSAVTSNLNAITVGLGLFIVVGDNGTILLSNDGGNWYVQPTPAMTNLYAVKAGSQFVTTGAGGAIFYGSTPTTTAPLNQPYVWTQAASGTTGDLRTLVYGYQRFLSAGAPSTLITSF